MPVPSLSADNPVVAKEVQELCRGIAIDFQQGYKSNREAMRTKIIRLFRLAELAPSRYGINLLVKEISDNLLLANYGQGK